MDRSRAVDLLLGVALGAVAVVIVLVADEWRKPPTSS